MNVSQSERMQVPTAIRHFSPISSKIGARHLERLAIVYVRQSSARQVRENVESTQLQYRLTERARALGWSDEQTMVIDDDLGLSGQSLVGREGFQRLLAEVSLGHVGIVMGIEMSRLARSCRDWHHLLELCAMFGSLLGDADGTYDPRDHNDRLLLGLKGTMSEAELHILKGRLDAGRKNKARRGEYFAQAPIGYVRNNTGMALDPDDQVRGVVQLVLDKFDELGSANAVLKFFRQEQINIPLRLASNPGQGTLTWRVPTRSTLLGILHHPIYAGAYVFGRSKTEPSCRAPGKPGSGRRSVARDEWQVLIQDALPAYITWAQWERNQQRITENSTKYGVGAARGVSVLAGRVVCGKCGLRMAIHYKENNQPYFTCSAARCHRGDPVCQSFGGQELETLVVRQVLSAMQPASVELSLKAAECIESDQQLLEQHHQRTVERATYEAELARRRYEEVDPGNRLVAAELERRWEASLLTQRKTEEALNRFRREVPMPLTAEQRQAIVDLAHDIPALWHNATNLDRQHIVRSLVDRVVVEVQGQTERLAVSIHWAGGFQSEHEVRRRVNTFRQLEASAEITARIQQLYDEGYPLSEIARLLNQEGFKPAKGTNFTKTSMGALCRTLRRQGIIAKHPKVKPNYWRAGALSQLLSVKKSTLSGWRTRHWVQARQVGTRWIYWADQHELNRLHSLAAQPPNGSTPAPAELTKPASRMPIC